MSRLKKLRDRKAALAQQMSKFNETHDESDWGEEQDKEWASFQEQLKGLNGQIERQEELQEMERSMGTVPDGNQETPEETADRTGQVIVKEKHDPMAGFKSPREFFQVVASAYTDHKVDDRLKPLMAVGSDEQNTREDPYGGFLVPESMSPDMKMLGAEMDPMAGRITSIPMDSPTVKFLARVDKDHSTSVSGGLTVSRREEMGEINSSRMEIEKVSLTANSLFGLAFATEELITDSPRSIAALLETGFRDEFPSAIINERINGTGVGEYLGILKSPCLLSIPKESGQAAGTIDGLNVIKMRSRCWGYQNAIWIANHDAYVQLIQLHVKVETDNGLEIIKLYQQSMQEDRPDTLLGRPIYYSEYPQTVGAKGDLILGNWSQYLEGTYQPMRRAESVHVRFLHHERAFKFWTRNDGAPWWRSVLKPKNSTETRSPFVVLDERA